MTILAGDIGGTKTVLALYEKTEQGVTMLRDMTMPSKEFDSLELAIEKFLDAGPRPVIETCCLGVAGPVVDGRCVATNLPWVIDERTLAYAIPASHVKLLNDLEAAAHGVLALPDDDLQILQAGVPRRGNLVLVSAGTGLGEALIIRDGPRRVIIASEGGHADFAPRNELEDNLLRWLRKEYAPHVSWERILSGPGLFNVYRFLRDSGFAKESPAVAERLKKDPGPLVVGEAGLAGSDPMCEKALDMFISIYGAEAGNLALTAMAVGGVIIGGGIAPRLVPKLTTGAFIAAFRDKGRLAAVLDAIPVSVALNPRAPLIGAANVALELL